MLVRSNQPEEAAQFIRRNWPQLRFEWPNTRVTWFDVKFGDSLSPVFEKLDRDDLRYFAELFFASAPDVDKSQPVGNAESNTTSRDDRMRQLGEKFSEIEFADAALRRRSLVILSLCKATRDS